MAALELPDPPLSDGVVGLRALHVSDVDRLVELCQDPEIPRWTLVPSPYTAQHAREYLERAAVGLVEGTRTSLAIVDAADGPLLGTASLMAIDRALGHAEVGYWLGKPARGRGVASRAVQLLAQWAFGPLGLARLEIHVDEQNIASQAVATRAGFASVPEPAFRRPETAHFVNDVYFGRTRAA